MGEAIITRKGGKNLSFITAGAGQILSGYVGSDTKGNPIGGAVPLYGWEDRALNCGQSYYVQPGWHAGGTISANSLASQTAANATAAQIASGYYAWVNGQAVWGSGAIAVGATEQNWVSVTNQVYNTDGMFNTIATISAPSTYTHCRVYFNATPLGKPSSSNTWGGQHYSATQTVYLTLNSDLRIVESWADSYNGIDVNLCFVGNGVNIKVRGGTKRGGYINVNVTFTFYN